MFSAVKGRLVRKLREAPVRKGLVIYKATVSDGEDVFTVTFFNNKFAFNALKEGWEYIFYGRVTGSLVKREMNSPQVIPADSDEKMRPVYPLTEGLTNAILSANIHEALEAVDELEQTLDESLRERFDLLDTKEAIRRIHFPIDKEQAEAARRTVAFEELLTLQLGLLMLKRSNRSERGFAMHDVDMKPFYESLPFKLTGAQLRAIDEIICDLTGIYPMNRLVQGDVGSGKTAVAAAACYFVSKNGCQSALMAPTEILVRQHYKTLSDFLEPSGIRVCCLTGSLTPKQKSVMRQEIADGLYDVIVGTHALVSETTVFRSLSLCITDEQHRFGVNQRATLADKGKNPHRLVMSATPIPRTLALIIYGDLDISILNELPAGRLPVKTFAVTGKLRRRAYNYVKGMLDNGRQGYIVCPMIEENEFCDETSELAAATDYARRLSENDFKEYSVGLLHGKMLPADKDKVMSDFKRGDIQLLVSTTVIEVGVDVPNATIMVIENADRFGLSQLHQLRGRVGRGQYESSCILITDSVSDEIRARMKIMTATTDGFKIAEEDLRLRGSGDFFGSRQHGLPPLKMAGLLSDTRMVAEVQQLASEMTDTDSTLSLWPAVRTKISRMLDDTGENAFN